MPYWSIAEWRARIGSSWCALGRPFKTRSPFRCRAGKTQRAVTLSQGITVTFLLILSVGINLGLCALVAQGHHLPLFDSFKGETLPDKIYVINLGFILTLILQTTYAVIYQLLPMATRSSKSFISDLTESLSVQNCFAYYSIFLILKRINPSMYPIHWLILSGIPHAYMQAVIHSVDCLRSLSIMWRVMANKQDLIEMQHIQHTCMYTDKVVTIMTRQEGSTLRMLVMVKAALDVMLSLATSVIISILLLSGDVEENAGPLESGIDYHSNDTTELICLAELSGHFTPTSLCIGKSDYRAHETVSDVHIDVCATVLTMLLLLLAGDVETNPGPLGKLSIKTVRSVLYSVRANWKNIGIELDIDIGTLRAIEKQYKSDPDECLTEMLDCWLKQTPPPSWDVLAKALDSDCIGEGDLAEQIRNSEREDEDAVPSDIPSLPLEFQTASVVKYSALLKAKYNKSTLISDNKWPPTPSTKYINLACIDRQTVSKEEADEFTKYSIHGNIDDICYKKTPISMEQVACKVKKKVEGEEVESYPDVVLVGGAPGVGKTTFAWELCRRWACGELLQDFSLVVLLRLRDKRTREAKELIDLFPCPTKSLSESLVDELSETNGESVLFLLEGFDELPENARLESSIYLDLINGDLLPYTTVLVTSRPWALSDFHWRYSERISESIEILGFTKQHIDEYLKSISTNDPKLLDELRRYVSLNPPVYAAMYIPLNAVIVCDVYKKRRNTDSVIPNTMSELYMIFSLSLLIRHLSDPGHKLKVRRLNKFEDLPPAVYQQFHAICKLASEGISNNQQLIFSDLSDDFETLGFMQSVSELDLYGVSVSYNFLHLTVQEFLAAYYLTLQPEAVQKDSLSIRNSRGDSFVGMSRMPTMSTSAGTVAKFVAGITKLQNDVMSKLLPVPSANMISVNLQISRSLDQTSKRSMFSLVPDYRVNISTRPKPKTAFIHYYGSAGIIVYDNTTIEIQCHVFLKGSSPYCSWFYESQNLQILRTCFGDKTALIQLTSDMTPMDCFAAGWCIANSSCVWKLSLFQEISLDCIEMLHAGIKHSTTRHGRITCELYTSETCSKTAKHFQKLLDTLDAFDVVKISYHCSMHRQNYADAALLAHLVENSLRLKEVEVVLQSLGNPGFNGIKVNHAKAQAVSDAILRNKSMERLSFVSGEGVLSANITECVKNTLTHLSIQRSVNINLNVLKPFCSSGSKLVYLDLTCTRTGECSILAELLRRTTTLETLILDNCKMYIGGIGEALKVNQSLRTLDLSGYHIGTSNQRDWRYQAVDLPHDSQVDQLAEMLKVNQTLQLLRLGECDLSKSESTILFQVFTRNENSTLLTLDVRDNSYSIKDLEEMLNTNTSLQSVDITVTPACDPKHSPHKTHIKGSQPQSLDSDTDYYVDSDAEYDAEYDAESENYEEFATSPGMLAYVDRDETLQSVCQILASAVNKNSVLQHLIVHTLREDLLKQNFLQYHDYSKVKDRIQIVQSGNKFIEKIRYYR